mgnify:CR=1 FL=1
MLKYLFYIIFGIILFILINNKEKFNIGGLNPGDPCMSARSNCNLGSGICGNIEENASCVCTLLGRGYQCIDTTEGMIGGRCVYDPDGRGSCNPGNVCIRGTCRSGGGESGFGTLFVNFLPVFTDEQEPLIPNGGSRYIKEYTIEAIEKFKTYRTNLNLVRLNRFDDSKMEDIQYVVTYCYDFIIQISEYLSNSPYPNDIHTFGSIPRPNHGVLNHIRCFIYGSYFINLLKTILSPDQWRILFPNNKKLALMLLSTMFESIMRVDERGSGGVLSSIGQEYFNDIYPDMDYAIFSNLKLSPHQLASSVFYKVIMGHCFFDSGYTNFELQKLSLGVAFHWSYGADIINIDTPNVDTGDKLSMADINENNYLKFYIEYILIIIGHYADHCRLHQLTGGRPYKMIKQQEFQKFYEIVGLQDNGENGLNDFSKFIVKILNITQSCNLNDVESVDYSNIHLKCLDDFVHPNTARTRFSNEDKCDRLDFLPSPSVYGNPETFDIFAYLSIPNNAIESLQIRQILMGTLAGFPDYESFIQFYNEIIDMSKEFIERNTTACAS